METTFDFLAVALFIATAGLFFHRLRHEDPALAPYMLICLVCAVSNWLGNHGGGAGRDRNAGRWVVFLAAISQRALCGRSKRPIGHDMWL